MTLKSGFLLVVMAVLASWKLCAADAVRGRYRLRSLVTGLEVDPAAQKRLGSLTFLNKADINSTKGKFSFVLSKLQQMAPSVQCGDNLMTLAVKRTGAPPFLVDSGQAPLVPLSQMPHYCGFSMKRSRRDIQYSTPYRGCYVNKQDGDYVLPLRLMGEPMAMSCPTTLPMPYIFCFPSRMLVRMAGVSANEFKVPPMLQSSPIQMSPMLQSSPIQMPPMLQSSQYKFPMFPQFPMMPEISQPTPSSAPTTTKALVTTPPPSTEPKGKHEVPRHPQFPLLPQYPFLPISKPSSPKSDATNDPNIAQPVKPQHQLHPSFSFPVLYPPLDPHSSRQLQQTRTPASPAEVTKEPPAQESFYQPHPLMPLYLIPKQAPVPLFLNPSDNPAQSQPFYPAMPHMYSFIPEQRQVQLARSW
uniref:Uncharacterized protein n=1 Tax=Oryzias latipes TaxID=8090 RepID=A0A3P9JYQ3_ORYLA